MTYPHIPLYPYDTDPLRILGRKQSRPAGTDPAGPAMTEEAPDDGPAPASAADVEGAPPGEPSTSAPVSPWPSNMPGQADDPPPVGEVAAASAADGGEASSDAAGGESSLPPPHSGEDVGAERIRIMRAWMNEHWDTVEAMARAGEAPQRPAPSPPEPPAADEAPPPPPPVPRVRRGDRWDKPKMAEFIRQLAATHSVTAAARAVGMTPRSAHRLRNRLKGQPFDIAWEAAFRHSYDDLACAALELAIEGEEVPHYHQGELVGTHRKRNPQLILGLLKMRNQAGAPMLGRYGAAAEYWTENWDRMLQRVETGSVTWDDEREAVGQEELDKLQLTDASQDIDRIIARNRPDEPAGHG